MIKMIIEDNLINKVISRDIKNKAILWINKKATQKFQNLWVKL